MVVALLTVERLMVEAAVPDPITTICDDAEVCDDLPVEVVLPDEPVEAAALPDAVELVAAAELSWLDEGAVVLDESAEVAAAVWVVVASVVGVDVSEVVADGVSEVVVA